MLSSRRPSKIWLAKPLSPFRHLTDYLLSRQSVKHGLPFKPLAEAALEKLRGHAWPGNVRELQNVLERAAMLSRGVLIEPADIVFDSPGSEVPFLLAPPVQFDSDQGEWRFPEAVDGHWPSLEECEREFLAATLRHTGFNQAAAARLLDMDRSVLRRRIKKLGLDDSRSTPSSS